MRRFPVVQQNRPRFVAVTDAVLSRPAMEVAADLSFAVLAECPEHRGRGEHLPRLKAILRSKRIDSPQRAQMVGWIDFESELKAARPFQRRAVNRAAFFIGLL